MQTTANEFSVVVPAGIGSIGKGTVGGWALRLRRLASAAALLLAGALLSACGGHDHETRQLPAITAQPADRGVVEGSAATFTVSAVGAATLTYQWSSSNDGGATFVAIAGATTASYSTGSTTQVQSGTRYRVVVSNDLGSVTSSTATLTVSANVVAPTITVQPADALVTAPGTASFHVTATGTSLSYAWQLSADGTTFAVVPGAADAPSLDVADTTTLLSGTRYRVIVSNSAGSIASNAALLTVSPTPTAPMFTTQPSSQSIFAGAAVDFVAAATGMPAPSIQWQLGGAVLTNGTQASGLCAGATVAGAATPTLTVSAVPLSCTGAVFSALASNGVAPDASSAAATLTVSPAPAAPLLTAQPANASVSAGSTATFSATATGVPTPGAQWQLSTNAGMSWANITGATGTSYSTPATTVADDGTQYRVVFVNASGTATSNAAVLSVVTPPSSVSLALLAGDIGGEGTIDGSGIAARFYQPFGTAIDASGNVYVADEGNSTIRKITPMGIVSTFAGTPHVYGFADGSGAAATFSSPEGVAVDRATGNVYVADSGNNAIRKITPAGVVTTLAGTGEQGGADGAGASVATFYAPGALAVDASGNVFVADTNNSTIRKITPAGVVSTIAGLAQSDGSSDGPGATARFYLPYGIAVDAAGNLYVADTLNDTIRKITPAGVVSTLAGSAGGAGAADASGAMASFNEPAGIAVDAMGFLYVSDVVNSTIRLVTPAGVVSTLAGSSESPAGSADGAAASAQFNVPIGVALDGSGTLYIADALNSTIRTLVSGQVSTIAGQALQTGSADGSATAARFNSPLGVAADAAGNVYVADYLNSTVRKITPAGGTSTLAGMPGSPGSADGTGGAASFAGDAGVAVDGAGNVFVSDSDSHTIRKITPAGVVSTFAGTAGVESYADGTGAAAQFDHPAGMAIDTAGNLYVADQYNSVIRKITPAGVVSTVAGQAGVFGSSDGTGPMASFNSPTDVAVDSAGNLFVVDYGNSIVRKIAPGGVVTTLAGTAGVVGSADGSGSAASFNSPQSVAVDAAGNLYVTDTANHTLRKITPAGVVTTAIGVAGQSGIRLGNDPRLYYPISVCMLSGHRVAISTRNAIVVATLP